jgi:hypothetical protein
MVLWWIGNAALLVAVLAAALLAHRLVVQALEVRRYADDILVHGVGLAEALEPVPALADTRMLVASVAERAGAYVTALERRLAAEEPR